jgi:hypothetical protein
MLKLGIGVLLFLVPLCSMVKADGIFGNMRCEEI